MNNKIEAVVFDLDGVITDTAHYHYLAWKSLADFIGIEIDAVFNERLKGVSRIDSLKLIIEHGGRTGDFSDEEIEQMAFTKNEHYCEYLKLLSPKDILPGIHALILAIREDQIKVGLASVSKNALVVLKALEIEHLFDYCVDAAKIKRSKPDPEVFLTACEKLQVSPERSIGIEDALVGIEAIHQSNMFAVGVGELLTKADLRVNDTSELNWQAIKASYDQR